jgi:deoxyadenosine/deoxycytidine kinase
LSDRFRIFIGRFPLVREGWRGLCLPRGTPRINMKKYLVLAGNIGAGKSTLVGLLAERLGFSPYYEPVAENPYLVDFYADMRRWALQSQLFFLTHRVRSHRSLMEDPRSVVQDRSIYEDAEIFARNLYEQGSMSDRDWNTYRNLYRTLIDLLPAPDLVVYLKASVPTLRKRIALRGREMEASIPDAYLAGLNRLYEEWIECFELAPALVVPCDRLDFVAESKDLDSIVTEVEHRLRDKQGSLFPVDM